MSKTSFRLIFATFVATEGSRVIAVSFAPSTKTALGEDGLTSEFIGNLRCRK